MSDGNWHDINEIDDFKEYYQFNDYVVVSDDIDEDGDHGEVTDIAFGIALFPDNAKRFFCIPHDELAD